MMAAIWQWCWKCGWGGDRHNAGDGGLGGCEGWGGCEQVKSVYAGLL